MIWWRSSRELAGTAQAWCRTCPMRAINIDARKSEIVQGALFHMTVICLPEQDFTLTIPFAGEDVDNETRAFVEELESAFGAVDFSTLNVLRFTPPEEISELYASEHNQENIKRQTAPTGADEARSVVAVFTVADKFCALSCDVMRYGDRWFMYKPHGYIAAIMGLSVLTGGMVAVPIEELMALRGELDTDAQIRLDALLIGVLDLLEE